MNEFNEEPAAAEETTEGGGPPRELSKDARTWAMVCHLTGLVSFLGPLIVWIVKRDEDPFIDDQGKEALNFQISIMIYGFIAGLSTLIMIGCFLVPLVVILNVVFVIIASVQANSGVQYRYPIAIRFIR